jgi:WD40 repeat protein
LWDVATGKELWQVDDYPSYSQCLRFSPDGKLLAAAHRKGMVVLRDATTGKVVREIPLAAYQEKNWRGAYRLAFSPDGKTLAVAYDEWVRLLDVASGQERRRIAGSAYSLAFAPDGKRLAVGDRDTTILIWDVSGR